MAFRAIHTHPIANSESTGEISIGRRAYKEKSRGVAKKILKKMF